MEKNKYLETITAKLVIEAFEKYVRTHSDFGVIYENWYVGVTNKPLKRMKEHKYKGRDTYRFGFANARSKNIACAVEKYFHDKGMKDRDNIGNAKKNSWYIYVFKHNRNFFDLFR